MPMPSTQQNPATDTCPYCGHDITHDELLNIESRIEKEQAEKFAKQAKHLSAKHMGEMSELRKQLIAKDQDNEKQAAAAAEAARREERERLKNENETEAKKLTAQRDQLKADRKKLDDQKAQQELEHEREKETLKKVLTADFEKQILSQRAANDKENQRMQSKLEDMKRQLEKKSNEELGDGAEVDLYNELKAAFPDDVITRVKKGVAGADIKHEVHVDGRYCGKIVYDSKNRANWRAKYVEQLRNDQLSEKADHAILATRKFPQNTKELAIRDGVLMINPARAVALAQVLRDAVIAVSSVKLSESGRADKQQKLYEFVTSSRCTNQFARFGEEVAHLRQIDEREKTQQEKNRRDRARHVGEMEKTVLGELQREMHQILGI